MSSLAYTVNGSALQEIDVPTMTFTGRSLSLSDASFVRINNAGTTAYVAGFVSTPFGGTPYVYVVDLATMTLTASIVTPSRFTLNYGMDITPDDSTLYVSLGNVLHGVGVIDTASNTYVTTISVTDPTLGVTLEPGFIVAGASGSTVYVIATFVGSTTYVLELDVATNTQSGCIDTGTNAGSPAFAVDLTETYAYLATADSVSAVDLSTGVTTPYFINISPPNTIAVYGDPAGGNFFVTQVTNTLSEVTIAGPTSTSCVVSAPNMLGFAISDDGSTGIGVYYGSLSQAIQKVDLLTMTAGAVLAGTAGGYVCVDFLHARSPGGAMRFAMMP